MAGVSSFGWHAFVKPAGGKACPQEEEGRDLSALPPLAAAQIWGPLSLEDRRSLRSAGTVVCSLFSRAVSSLELTGRNLQAGDIKRLGSTFPDLSKLHLMLGPEPSGSSAMYAVQELTKVRFHHLHSFHCDVKLQGEAFLCVGRFLVHTPSLSTLCLPNQRASSPADQRVLCAVLEALPNLKELDLGGAGSSSSGSNAVGPSVFRRILRLQQLQRLSCNAADVPDEQLQSLAQLSCLSSLSISATGSSCGLAAAVQKLHKLSSLEVQHPTLSVELVGCLSGLSQLQVLSLGLCPKLTEELMTEVSALHSLQKLSLPFPITPSHLRLLSHLPNLSELLSWRSIELDVLGLAHEPLTSVTKLVASSIDGHGKPLSAWFPGLQAVCLRSCSDMEALSLRGCAGLSVLMAGDCSGLTDEGFAALKDLRLLQRLQMEAAGQVSDMAFAVVFSKTMPALQQISLSGCHRITDMALQVLTASCRRLASISISSCRQLTDKSLRRLAHCEHLSNVTLKGCAGLTAEGVAALAAAPHMKAVVVASCPGVRKSQCRGFRSGVKVRVDSTRRQ